MTSRRALVPLLSLLFLGPLLTVSQPTARAQAAVAPTSTLRVAVANLFEGGLLRPRADLRGGADRRQFVRRALRQGVVPDVVLAQEVLGSAFLVASALNAHPRSRRSGARYVVVTPPGLARRVTGACDGRRGGRFAVLRSSAVIVNARTTRVLHRGSVRTWGRWKPARERIVGRNGHGCSAHPWARVRIQQPGRSAITALVTSVHLAPLDPSLKHRAAVTLQRSVRALGVRTPRDVVVLGGDLNLTRCLPSTAAETRGCRVSGAHRSILAAGFRDAVRTDDLSGATGVVGQRRRIDYVYVLGRTLSAWYDRCYQAYFVTSPRCGARAVFSSQRRFFACQTRALHHATSSRSCPSRWFTRYYSDHPVLLAALRPPG